MRKTTQLRKLIERGVVAASVYDSLSARLAELAGFDALYFSGFGIEATQLGAPDIGLMTLTELALHASRAVDVVSAPILSDIDTGFGGVNNIQRTIRTIERCGIAGVQIEDQTSPKRCPIVGGRQVISRDEAVGRIKAAVDARLDPDFVIVARSDADIISTQEVIDRCNFYLEAGADMVIPGHVLANGASYASLDPKAQMDFLREVNSRIDGKVMNFGLSPPVGFTGQDMLDAGYSFVFFAGSAIAAVANTLHHVFSEIRTKGTDEFYLESHPGPFNDFRHLMDAIGLAAYTEAEANYGEHRGQEQPDLRIKRRGQRVLGQVARASLSSDLEVGYPI